MDKNPFLVVSVARGINVKKIKGKRPMFTEKKRLVAIKKCKLVDKAVLGGLKNYLPHILKQAPGIIALGYDQRAYVNKLKDLLKKRGLKVKIVKLKAFYPKIYKSSLICYNWFLAPFCPVKSVPTEFHRHNSGNNNKTDN